MRQSWWCSSRLTTRHEGAHATRALARRVCHPVDHQLLVVGSDRRGRRDRARPRPRCAADCRAVAPFNSRSEPAPRARPTDAAPSLDDLRYLRPLGQAGDGRPAWFAGSSLVESEWSTTAPSTSAPTSMPCTRSIVPRPGHPGSSIDRDDIGLVEPFVEADPAHRDRRLADRTGGPPSSTPCRRRSCQAPEIGVRDLGGDQVGGSRRRPRPTATEAPRPGPHPCSRLGPAQQQQVDGAISRRPRRSGRRRRRSRGRGPGR